MDLDSNHINSRERFFSIPPNADPVLKNLVDRLKEREAKQPFVNNFIKYEGYPIWKNALISFGNKNNTSNITADGAIDTLVSIPIVPDSAVYVKSILKVKISTDLLFKLYQRASYALNGFDNDPARTKSNANDIVAEIMMFEKEIFNLQNLFIIKDPRLFTIRPDTVSSSDPFFVSASRASLCTIEVHWTTMTPVYDASGCLKDMEYENHYEHYNTVCTDGGEGWGPDPSGPYSAGGGGEIPPAPLPPCNPGWDRITVSHDFKYFEGDCTPQIPIPTEPPISNPSPCDKTNKLKTIPSIKQLFNTLKGEVYPNANPIHREFVGTFTDLGEPITTPGPIITNIIDATVPIPVDRFIIGYLHTHPFFSPQPVIPISPIFTIGDLKSFYNLYTYRDDLGHPVINLNSFVLGVTTGYGESYFLTIDDINEFNTFGNTWLGNDNVEDLVNQYKYFNISPSNSPATNELNFLQFLSSVHFGGTLLKANADFSEYTMVTLNHSGNSTISTPCL